MRKLDKKDWQILAEIDMNARIPLTQLAKKVGLSRQMIEYRIKRMEKKDIIFGYITVFDSAVVGVEWYRVTFRLLNITKEKKNTFINFLKNHKYVGWVGEVGGNWDLILNFMCKNIRFFHF